ncbi:hypothetical protein C8Q76DRAFT_694558 [Earliella scabrosa]|nr:hypothetical protein C8Q76DRAFT_694558 [Earliella scabrosa]
MSRSSQASRKMLLRGVVDGPDNARSSRVGLSCTQQCVAGSGGFCPEKACQSSSDFGLVVLEVMDNFLGADSSCLYPTSIPEGNDEAEVSGPNLYCVGIARLNLNSKSRKLAAEESHAWLLVTGRSLVDHAKAIKMQDTFKVGVPPRGTDHTLTLQFLAVKYARLSGPDTDIDEAHEAHRNVACPGRNSAPTPAEPGSSSLSAQVNSAPPVAAQGNLIPHAAVQVIPPPPTPVNLATPAVATVNPAPLAQVNLAPSTVNPPLPAQANHLPPTPTQQVNPCPPAATQVAPAESAPSQTTSITFTQAVAQSRPRLPSARGVGVPRMQPEFIQCLKEQYAREHGVAISKMMLSGVQAVRAEMQASDLAFSQVRTRLISVDQPGRQGSPARSTGASLSRSSSVRHTSGNRSTSGTSSSVTPTPSVNQQIAIGHNCPPLSQHSAASSSFSLRWQDMENTVMGGRANPSALTRFDSQVSQSTESSMTAPGPALNKDKARATDPMEWEPDTGMDDMGTGEEQRPGGEGGDDEAVEGPDDEDWEKGDGGAIPRAEGPAQDMARFLEHSQYYSPPLFVKARHLEHVHGGRPYQPLHYTTRPAKTGAVCPDEQLDIVWVLTRMMESVKSKSRKG